MSNLTSISGACGIRGKDPAISTCNFFALPNRIPACHRYQLQPHANTDIECGASVPLYGQSAGGVEVKFVKQTNNRCAIANPGAAARHCSLEGFPSKGC